MDAFFRGWSNPEIGFFCFLIIGLVVFLAIAVIGVVRLVRERREERAWESMQKPALAVLTLLPPPGPPTPEERLEAAGFRFVDIESVKWPPPRLACTVAFTSRPGGCGYCDDGALIDLYEIDIERAAWPLTTFCTCGAYQLRGPYGSDVLGAWYEWHDDASGVLEALEAYGPHAIDDARYRLLFARRDELQAQVDVLTTALISLEVSVTRRRRERAWKDVTLA